MCYSVLVYHFLVPCLLGYFALSAGTVSFHNKSFGLEFIFRNCDLIFKEFFSLGEKLASGGSSLEVTCAPDQLKFFRTIYLEE